MITPQKVDVLIIDDDKDICELMSEYLKDLALFRNIVVAHDGSMATLKLQNQLFGLIILDMNMPKKSGVGLLSEFEIDKSNKNKNEIKNVLVVSGTLDRELLARIVKSGIKNFLTKPFDEAAFKDKVKKMVS